MARPLQDLNVLLLEPLICCLGHVFWVIVMLEYPSTTSCQCPGWLQCSGPVHRPFDAGAVWSCPLSRKNTPKHNIFHLMFDGGDGVLGVIAAFLLLQTRRVELMPKTSIWSHLTTTLSPRSPQSLANFRRAFTCAFLSRRPCGRLQDFSPSRHSVLPIVFLVTMVPAALRSLTRSSHAVLD